MALYAFDGTGNEDRPGEDKDSNVFDFYEAYIDPLKNTDPDKKRGSLYLKGIGQRARTFVGDKVAEAFGIGGHRRVRQAMDRLENNIEAGDTVIDVVGFSRGAGLAISFANEIAKKIPNASIRFIGVWDVVGQFGAPGKHFNAGHDLDFPPNVAQCFHAMALDESRALFPLTRLGKGRNTSPKLHEVWFRGVHSDVGGGNGNIGMNWIALNWMYEAARRSGVPLDEAAVAKNLLHKQLAQQISEHKVDLGVVRAILQSDLLHSSVQLTPGITGRPHNNPTFACARIDDAGVITEVATT